MDEFNSGVTQEYSKQAGSKSKKILFGALILLGVLCIGALTVVSFFPEVILSPKNLYLLAEKQAGSNFLKQMDNYFSDGFVKDILKIYDTSYENKGEVRLNLKADNLTGTEAQQFNSINDLLSSSKLIFQENADLKNDQDRVKASLLLRDSKLLDADLFVNKEQAGISIPTIYNKYFTLNTNDLTPIYEKLGQKAGPKKLVMSSDVLKAIKMDKNDINLVEKDYSKFWADYVTDKDVTLTKGTEMVTSEGNIKCNQLTLKLDNARTKDFLVKLGEKVAGDDRLLNLTAGNFINVMKLYEDAGYFDDTSTKGLPEEMKDINAVKKSIKDAVEKLKSNETDGIANTNFVMTLFVDNKLNVLERKIQIINNKEGSAQDGVTFRIANYVQPRTKAKNNLMELKIEDNSTNGMVELYYNYLEPEAAKGKPKTCTVTIDAASTTNGKEDGKLTSTFNSTIEELKDKHQKLDSDFNIAFNAPGENESIGVSGKITSTADRDPANKALNYTFGINADIKPSASETNEQLGFELNTTSNIKFEAPVQMPELKAGNTVDLNTASQEEIMKEFEEVQTAAVNFVMQNAQLFNTN